MTLIKQDGQKMKKKKKKTKLSTRNEIESNSSTANPLKCNLISKSPKQIHFSETSDKTEDTYFHKNKFSSHISVAKYISEVEKGLTVLKKKKKKKKDKKREQNNEKIKKEIAALKSDEFNTETCNDICTNLNKDIIGATNLNKGKTKTINNETRLHTTNEDEYTRLKRIVKKIKKEKKRNQQIQLINNLKNENDPIQTKKRVYNKNKLNECNEMLLDFNEPFNKIHNLAATSLCTDYVNVLKSPSKKIKKSKIATEEETETSKDETKNKIHKKMKYLNKVIADDCSKEINIDTEMINNTHNLRISKVHKESSKFLHKSLKKKKKAIKAEKVSTEQMLTKKPNKNKRQTTAKEYLANSYPRSVDMTNNRRCDNNDQVSREDGNKADTDLYFSRHYGKESIIANSSSTDHKNVHVRKSSFGCDVCFRTFISKSKLCVHEKTHTGEKPHTCDTCGRSFTNSSQLVRHNKVHTGVKPHMCDVCRRSFSQKHNLFIHYRTHTGEKPYACDICGLSFAHKFSLVVHYRTHTGEKPHTCDTCGRSFTNSSHLVRHNKVHTGVKPHMCDVCRRSFSQKSNLVIHYRTHTGEKPYTCDICGLSFAHKFSLVYHNGKHTGENSHACDVCGRSFMTKSDLVKHNRTHTGEKPYACGCCKKEFSTSGHRLTHILNVHFKCF